MSDRHPAFVAYCARAKQAPEIWRILLGLALIVFCVAAGTTLILAVVLAAVNAQQGLFAVMPFLLEIGTGVTPAAMLVLLSTFGGMFLGAILAAAACHFRGPASLFGPWQDWWRGFAVTALLALVILGGFTALAFALGTPLPNLALADLLPWLPLALVLIFVQTGAEELVFRGYLQQQLAARFAARSIWMGVPATVFALLHWNDAAGWNLPLVLLATLIFAFAASDLTERTGSLGAAMGLHFMNNALALLVLGTGPQLTGLALYLTDFKLSDTGLPSLYMALNAVVLLLIWGAARRILDR